MSSSTSDWPPGLLPVFYICCLVVKCYGKKHGKSPERFKCLVRWAFQEYGMVAVPVGQTGALIDLASY